MTVIANRSSCEITLEILRACEKNGGMYKTHIVRKVHITNEKFNRHIRCMEAKGMLKSNDSLYSLTKEGQIFKDELESVVSKLCLE